VGLRINLSHQAPLLLLLFLHAQVLLLPRRVFLPLLLLVSIVLVGWQQGTQAALQL
jgi:hypothetical protein